MAPSIALQFKAAQLAAVAACQQDLAAFAKREHGKVMKATPRPTAFRRTVDGRLGAAEETVKPFGVIEYRYQRLGEVVQFAMETLFALSPVLSGDYRNSHTLFVGGAAVRSLKGWEARDGEEVFIANPLPYARKIELGKMTMRVPGTERVYQQAELMLRRRFGNVAAIKFTYMPVFGLAQTGRARGRTAAKQAQDLRRPALVIRPL
ncbi:hypothetical protein SAMN04515666_11924 [Bosea lupini]|uniref:Uncharacterized protein n=1 Tax=Bosea lupini TaxID=1036779 RepID=A0A1H8AEJ4_9HYPH|nr:hypothetical protein [Bosea lupini]SEM68963.1 hypothetical protein SAMN04515666_11924 [Bosea lupini]